MSQHDPDCDALPSTARNITVNGVSLYVEEHGAGRPVVLVHGGTISSAWWAPLIERLAPRYRVIVFDSRGHGRSTNPTGELSYELIADDTAALIAELGLERPVVGGWSDGGQVALELAMRNPGVAGSLIAGGVMHAFKGDEFQNLTRSLFCLDADGRVDCDAIETHNAPVVEYMKALHSQSEQQWRDVAQQTAKMWLEYRDLSAEILANVREPTLVVSGDRDELIPLAHTLDIHRWLPDSELAILPGQDHAGPLTSPANLAQAIFDFVDRH